MLAVLRFTDEDEVVAQANDSDFGLGAYLHTRDVSRAQRLAGARGRDRSPSTGSPAVARRALRRLQAEWLRPRGRPGRHRGDSPPQERLHRPLTRAPAGSGPSLVAVAELAELLVAEMTGPDQLLVRLFQGKKQFVELQLDRLAVPVLGVLEDDDHQERKDRHPAGDESSQGDPTRSEGPDRSPGREQDEHEGEELLAP